MPDAPVAPTAAGNLCAEPVAFVSVLVGYGRVSTAGKNLHHQRRALEPAGCAKVFLDIGSGRDAAPPEFTAARAYLRLGDALVVRSLDRLSRSLADLPTLIAGLRRAGVGFRSLHEALDITTPGGRLCYVFAALAEFIRELIVDGTREGLDAGRACGTRLGRSPAPSPQQVRHTREPLTHPDNTVDNTVASIVRLLGVSRSTLDKNVLDLSSRQPTAPIVVASQ